VLSLLFQMLVYLYYFVPFYVIVIYSLLVPGCHSMPDWALIFAGASGQVMLLQCINDFNSSKQIGIMAV